VEPIQVYLLLSFGAFAGFFLGILMGGIRLADKRNDALLSSISPSLIPEARSTEVQYVEDVKIIDTKTWHTEVSGKISLKNFEVKSHPLEVKVVNNGSSIVVWSRWEKK
jgi:hypothetical protein